MNTRPEPVVISLERAKFCLDCQKIFANTMNCPACASTDWHWVAGFLKTIDEEE